MYTLYTDALLGIVLSARSVRNGRKEMGGGRRPTFAVRLPRRAGLLVSRASSVFQLEKGFEGPAFAPSFNVT